MTDCVQQNEGRLFLSVIVFSLSLSTVIQASTLENTDPDSYKYEATADSVPCNGTIYGNSTLYDFYNHGCVLKLIETGQTLEVQPDDHIIIDNGELKRQDN